MPVFQHRPASVEDFPAIISLLPTVQLGCTREAVLTHWQRWWQEGALSVGIVEAIEGNRPPVIASIGVTAWISDDAVTQLHQTDDDVGSVALYRTESKGNNWLLDQQQIEIGHAMCNLNLWIVHFWPDPDPTNPDFAALFVQSDTLFRELHDGFGVGRLIQEIPAEFIPMMQSAGMRVTRPAESGRQHALVSLTRSDARNEPGSLMSFLFLKPPGTLGLKCAEQVMLGLALQQLTDADIAARMGYTRDYVRKLWLQVYDALHASAALVHKQMPDLRSNQRGPEKRRLALEFFRDHPEELRPGLRSR